MICAATARQALVPHPLGNPLSPTNKNHQTKSKQHHLSTAIHMKVEIQPNEIVHSRRSWSPLTPTKASILFSLRGLHPSLFIFEYLEFACRQRSFSDGLQIRLSKLESAFCALSVVLIPKFETFKWFKNVFCCSICMVDDSCVPVWLQTLTL